MVELKYVDYRNLTFPERSLKYYPNGLSLPNETNIVKVSQSELKSMLMKRNGRKFCFEEKKKKKDDGGES